MGDWLKRIVDGIAALGFLGALLSGVIYASGGQLPPWPTRAEVQQMIKDDDAESKCGDYNGRFLRAQQSLRRNPDDMNAFDLYNSVLSTLGTIKGCRPAYLPR